MSAARFAAARRKAADPAFRAKLSAAKRAAWADPVKRANMAAAAAAGVNRPEVRAHLRRVLDWLPDGAKQEIVAAIARGESPVHVANDWLISTCRVSAILREAQTQ